MFERFELLQSVASTNDYLKAFTADGVSRAVRAQEQTGGKGRSGKSWLSEAGQGLFVSYLVFPGWHPRQAPYFIQIASLAVIDSIRECGGDRLDLRIKPPNDIYIGRRKVCGILTEMSTFRERIQWAIVGIGVNLFQSSFPKPLHESATSLHIEGLEPDADELCRRLTSRFEEHYRSVLNSDAKCVGDRYHQEKKFQPLGP